MTLKDELRKRDNEIENLKKLLNNRLIGTVEDGPN